jgi:hypothetical protein
VNDCRSVELYVSENFCRFFNAYRRSAACYYLYPDLYGKAAEKGISRLLFPTEEEEEKQELLIIDDEKKLI